MNDVVDQPAPTEDEVVTRPVERIIQQAYLFHWGLDVQIRNDAIDAYPDVNGMIVVDDNGVLECPTYHNLDHIQSVMTVVEKTIEEYDDGIDLFGLDDELDRWVEMNAHQFTPDELEKFISSGAWKDGLRLFAAGHDLGNLTHTRSLTQDGSLIFAEMYLEEGAEERSASIISELIDRNYPEGLQKEILKTYTKDLIMNSIYDTNGHAREEKQPMWEYIQLVDQIGSAYAIGSQYPRMVAGVINEFQRRGKILPRLRDYVLFIMEDINKLVPDRVSQSAYLIFFSSLSESSPILDISDEVLNEETDPRKHIPFLLSLTSSRP